MPDLKNREKFEVEIVSALAPRDVETVRDITRFLDETVVSRQDEQFERVWGDVQSSLGWRNLWDTVTGRYRGGLINPLQSTYIAGAGNMLNKFGFGVDESLIMDRGLGWASEYSYELVKGMNTNSQKILSKIVRNFFETDQSVQDLRAALKPIYGTVRADLIAVTEVTRAIQQAEGMVAGELEANGVRMRRIWVTEADGKVCAVCSPRHLMEQGTNWYDPPPAHGRCRCYSDWDVIAIRSMPFILLGREVKSLELGVVA